MIDLAIDDNEDLHLDETGDLAVVEGAAAVAQALKIGYRTIQGELFFAPQAGLPYIGPLTEKGTKPVVIQSLYLKDTLNTPGVQRVIDLRFEPGPDRVARVRVKVQSDQGLVEV